MTPVGEVLRVSTSLNTRDILGSWKARWGINRHHYTISPGLYGVGEPTDQSPVLVSANYKMSFDSLRKELAGIDAWILVLDTKGINVWCAAGKGTFGTGELVHRIEAVGLAGLVSHRKLILPQLGAPGVAAHEVFKKSGFHIIYGPVRASDLKAFLEAGMKATPDMRAVKFRFTDRIVLTPIELAHVIWPLAVAIAIILIMNLVGIRFISSFRDLMPYIGAILIGCVVVPALLPWVPGRAFAWKGWLLGFIWALLIDAYYTWNVSAPINWRLALFYLLILPPISSYLAMNFTGSSTYTSLSGVKMEMRIWLPIIIGSAGIGIVFMVSRLFLKF
ncbi:MAG: mercury methylation corrinoid protein HgcA [Thermacetogeniaceae bacterium]